MKPAVEHIAQAIVDLRNAFNYAGLASPLTITVPANDLDRLKSLLAKSRLAARVTVLEDALILCKVEIRPFASAEQTHAEPVENAVRNAPFAR